MQITNETILIIKKRCNTPFNNFYPGDHAGLQYWASKFGKSVDDFIQDFLRGSLDDWFEIKK